MTGSPLGADPPKATAARLPRAPGDPARPDPLCLQSMAGQPDFGSQQWRTDLRGQPVPTGRSSAGGRGWCTALPPNKSRVRPTARKPELDSGQSGFPGSHQRRRTSLVLPEKPTQLPPAPCRPAGCRQILEQGGAEIKHAEPGGCARLARGSRGPPRHSAEQSQRPRYLGERLFMGFWVTCK